VWGDEDGRVAEHDPVTSDPGTRSSAWASVVSAFAFHASIAGSLGPRFPAIKGRTGVSDSGLGIALVGFAAGLFVGTRLAAWPLRRFGSRPVLRLVVPLFAATLLGPAFARDLVSLAVALVAMGLASGLLDVAMNANAVVVERRAGRPIMSGIHGVWSAGLLASSGAAVVAAALDTSLLLHFGIVAAVIAFASLGLLRGLLGPLAEDVAGERAPRGGGSVSWPAVLPLGLIGFCSFLGEGSMHDWSAVYLNETLGASPATAALGFTGFALGMTVSRFVADRLIVRYGSVRVVRAGGLVASAGLVIGLLVPGAAAAIAGFTVLGAALAPVVPTVFSAAGNIGAGATALGWVVTISYVGGILGPGLIGFTAQVTGLRAALGIPAALALVIAALAGRAVVAPGSSRRADVPPPPTEGPW
jgi:MFS family permease